MLVAVCSKGISHIHVHARPCPDPEPPSMSDRETTQNLVLFVRSWGRARIRV